MEDFTYIADVPRTHEGFQRLAWDHGERPDWWRQDLRPFGVQVGGNIWSFQIGTTPRGFITQNLEDAVGQIQTESRFHITAARAREDLFLNAPLTLDDPVQLVSLKATATLHEGLQLTRDLWRRLEGMRETIRGLEAVTNGQLLRLGQGLVLNKVGVAMFDETHSFYRDFHLGPSVAYMREIAKGTPNYELFNFCLAYEQQQAENRTKQRAEDAVAREERRIEREEKREQREQTKRQRDLITQFIGYLGMDDFTPQNIHEEEAVRLYLSWTEQTTGNSRQHAKELLETHLVRHVISR